LEIAVIFNGYGGPVSGLTGGSHPGTVRGSQKTLNFTATPAPTGRQFSLTCMQLSALYCHYLSSDFRLLGLMICH
jgi:hypothetical protein